MNRPIPRSSRLVWVALAVLTIGVVGGILSAVRLGAQENARPAETPRPKTSVAPKNAEKPASTDDKASSTADEEEIVGFAQQSDEDGKAGITVLSGDVRIERENGYLYADKVTMYRDVQSQERDVQRTLAEGNVRLKDGEIVATCDVAEFTEGNNVIDLKGSKTAPVVVLEGTNRLEAGRFVYDRRTSKKTGSGGVKFRMKQTRKSAEAPPTGESQDKTTRPSATGQAPGTSSEAPAKAIDILPIP